MRIKKFQFQPLAAPEPLTIPPEEALIESIFHEQQALETILAEETSHATDPEPVIISNPPSEPEPLILTYSEEELQRQKEERYLEGYQDGLAAAGGEAQTREEHIQGLLATIARELTTFLAKDTQRLQQLTKQATDLALMVAEKVAGKVIQSYPFSPVEHAIQEAIAHLGEQFTLVIEISPELVEALNSKLTHFPPLQFSKGTWRIQANSTLTAGDCKVSWGDGAIEHSKETIWNTIKALIESQLLTEK